MKMNFICENCKQEYYRDTYKANDSKHIKELWEEKKGTEYGLCYDCYQEQKEEERQKANAEAAAKAEEQELPELVGSEKQIAWAEKLRENLFKLVEKNKDIPEHPTLKKRYGDIYKVFAEEIRSENRAKWFIDNRDEGFFNVMERYLKEKGILKVVEVVDARDEKWLVKFLGEQPQGMVQYSPKEFTKWKPIEWATFCEKAGIDVEMFKKEGSQ